MKAGCKSTHLLTQQGKGSISGSSLRGAGPPGQDILAGSGCKAMPGSPSPSPPVLRPEASHACSKLQPLLGAVVAGDYGFCSHSPDLCGEAAAQVLEGFAKLRALWQLGVCGESIALGSQGWKASE